MTLFHDFPLGNIVVRLSDAGDVVWVRDRNTSAPATLWHSAESIRRAVQFALTAHLSTID